MGQPVLWKQDLTPAEQEVLWFSINTAEGPLRPSGKWLMEEMRKYNHLQRRITEKMNGSFVPLQTQVPKTLDYFYDDCHFTDKGSRLAARQIEPAVLSVVKKTGRKRGLMV